MTRYAGPIPIGKTQPYEIRRVLQNDLGMTAYNDEQAVYGLTRPLSPDESPGAAGQHKNTEARIEIKDRTAVFSGSTSSMRRIVPVLRRFESVDQRVEEPKEESWLTAMLKRLGG